MRHLISAVSLVTFLVFALSTGTAAAAGPLPFPRQAIVDARSADATLWPVLLSLCYPESGCTSRAVGDYGCSIGYLQFNRCGGLGSGYSRASLENGAFNMALGARAIRGGLDRGMTLYQALWPWRATRDSAFRLLARMARSGVAGY